MKSVTILAAGAALLIGSPALAQYKQQQQHYNPHHQFNFQQHHNFKSHQPTYQKPVHAPTYQKPTYETKKVELCVTVKTEQYGKSSMFYHPCPPEAEKKE